MNKTFGYTRVSPPKQTTDPQLERLRQAGGDEIFVETVSGTNRKCSELEKLLLMVRDGDTVVIVKLDQLSRSLTDLLSIVKEIESKGAQLRSPSDLVQLILKKCLASITSGSFIRLEISFATALVKSDANLVVIFVDRNSINCIAWCSSTGSN